MKFSPRAVARGTAVAVLATTLAYSALMGVLAVGQLSGGINRMHTISGSMGDAVPVGSLIIEVRRDSAELEVGDVISAIHPVTGFMTTHRIVGISAATAEQTAKPASASSVNPTDPPRFAIEMRGDANAQVDGVTYLVGGDVWTPVAVIPELGGFHQRVTSLPVLVPGLVALGVLYAGTVLLKPRVREQGKSA